MMPFLIRTGRRVKDKLRHRRSYAARKRTFPNDNDG